MHLLVSNFLLLILDLYPSLLQLHLLSLVRASFNILPLTFQMIPSSSVMESAFLS